jgi:hypothetical protein
VTRARVIVLFASLGPAALAACSFVRSLDGYSTTFGLDAAPPSDSPGADGAEGGCSSCAPIDILIKDQAQPRGITVTTNYFFWTNEGSGTVNRCPIAGCGAGPALVGGNQAGPTTMTNDDYSVYWANSRTNGIGACSIDGCPAPVFISDKDGGNPVGVAVLSFVYWTTDTGWIFSCGGLCAFGGPQVVTSGQADPAGIAVFNPGSGEVPIWAVKDGVMKCDQTLCKNDGGPSRFADDPGPVKLVALDAKNVYWASDVAIRSCPIAGCTDPPTTVADVDHPRGIALDATHIYWTNGDNTVRYCPSVGCPSSGATVLAADQDDPQGIAVSPTHVYWTSRGLGTVARVPKPKN